MKATLEQFSAQVAVGSLVILGLFLAFDGVFAIFTIVDIYAKTSAWALVASVPFLVMSYLLGLIAIEVGGMFADSLVARNRRVTVAGYVRVVLSSNDHLVKLFEDLSRRRDMVRGAAVAALFLAFGSLLERRCLPGREGLAIAGTTGALGLAVISVVISQRFSGELSQLIQAVGAVEGEVKAEGLSCRQLGQE